MNDEHQQLRGWSDCPVCKAGGASSDPDQPVCSACGGIGKVTRTQLDNGLHLMPAPARPQMVDANSLILQVMAGLPQPQPDSDGVLLTLPGADLRCPICQDRGFVYPRLPDADPDYGRRRECVCQRSGLSARLERHWRHCGFDDLFLGCRLETHPIARDGADPSLMAELMSPSDAVAPLGIVPGWRRSWILFGGVGHGKTGLAAGYAWRFLFVAGGESVCFRTVPELLNELRSTYGQREWGDSVDGEKRVTEADLMHRYTAAGLLVLDDLGTEQLKVRDDGSSWALERLYTIVNKRYGNQAPMIVTSNYSPSQLAERMGDVMGQRILSRIAESCQGRDHIRQVKHRNLRYG